MDFACPLCRKTKEVMINRKSKPYFRCDDCGVLMFINKPKGIRLIRNSKDKILHKPRPETAGSYLFG